MAATTKIWENGQPPSCEDDDLNGFKNENNNLIIGAGLSLTPGDNQQTHQSVATYAAVGDFMQGGGVADAYTANAPAPRVNPPARKQGMIIRFIAPASNTGACTLNAFGTGVDDIKLKGGVTDPEADYIKIGEEITVIDRLTYFELVLNNLAGSVSISVLTVSGSYNPPAGVKSLEFVVVGGGGGGGAADGQGGGTRGCAGAGQAGGFSLKVTSDIESSYSIIIGSGGLGGTTPSNDGASGGVSSITSTFVNVSVPGGAPGLGVVGAAGVFGSGGDDPTLPTGGDINAAGEAGGSGSSVTGGSLASASKGGDSVFGGGRNSVDNADGVAGASFGAGGSGAIAGTNTTDRAGGAGADGVVVVKEYF